MKLIEKISLVFLFMFIFSTAGICEKPNNSHQIFYRNDKAYKTEILLSGSLKNPAWSPNGKWILFELSPDDPDNSPGTSLWIIEILEYEGRISTF